MLGEIQGNIEGVEDTSTQKVVTIDTLCPTRWKCY